jgi:copper oxidase (laccase) domain-containing protein
MRWREKHGVRWLEAELPGATAAFSTRPGGVSEAPFDSLNLGLFTDDERERVVENRHRLAGALGLAPERVAIGLQVHGDELAAHGGPQRPSFYASPGEGIPEVDGHVTAEPELALLAVAADCLPVALSGPGGVAILHCGWRNLAPSGPPAGAFSRAAPPDATSKLVTRAVDAIGATDAALGPSIGPCCYEVGEEVLGAFSGLGEGIASGRMLDLPEAARRQLRAAGVERVESAGLCTSCEAGLFFSHRRDGRRSGRQAGLVWRHGDGG